MALMLAAPLPAIANVTEAVLFRSVAGNWMTPPFRIGWKDPFDAT